MGHQLRIKRVYKPPEDADGVRVLVDRLWPRGLSKERARIDLWLKPSAAAASVCGRRFLVAWCLMQRIRYLHFLVCSSKPEGRIAGSKLMAD
jgi:uncharacterized protein YeaO (DUF488 family)